MANPPSALTREALLSGELARLVLAQNPQAHVLSDAERAASLGAILADRPEHGAGLWVFAYGSLLWNPMIRIVGREVARAHGWHRSFSLAARGGRGTAEAPGAMLGLEAGGVCDGAVLRIAEADIASELDLRWRREMVADGYIPRWLDVTTPAGGPLSQGGSAEGTSAPGVSRAIGFVINPAMPSYCGDLPESEIVRRLATARGWLGTAAEYVFNTQANLHELSIHDPLIERIAAAVAAY